MEGRRILIVCTWFPPANEPGARRPYFLARSLAQRGWQVSVLTSVPERYADWIVDLEPFRVHRAPRHAAAADLNAFQRLLLKARRTSLGEWWDGPVRVVADLLLPLTHTHRWGLKPEDVHAALGPQDLVLATGPDWSALETGAQLARYWKAAWCVDYRDPWNVAIPEVAKDIMTGQGKGLAGTLRRRRMRGRERRLCASADLITAVSQAFLDNAVAITGNGRAAVVPGGFDPGIRPTARIPGPNFVITHTGHLYPEQPWDLVFGVLRTLRETEPALADRLRVRFVGPSSTRPSIMRELEETARTTGTIEITPYVDRLSALAFQADSDVLLQLALTGRKGYLPVKFLEYLGAWRSILLVSGENDEMESLLRSTRTGTIVRDRDAFLRWLVQALRSHEEGRPLIHDPDAHAVERCSYPQRMSAWCELLEQVMRTRA